MTTTAVTVTIPPSAFARVAADHAARALSRLAEADRILVEAQARASQAPADFRTTGGADAATVYRFMCDDRASVANSANLAAHEAEVAAAAESATTAAQAEELARVHYRSAVFDVETMHRYLNHLPL